MSLILFKRFQVQLVAIFLTAVLPFSAFSETRECADLFSKNSSQVTAPKFVPKDDPVLRSVTPALSQSEIRSPETKDLVTKMLAAMNAKGGVGIAAPQLGVSKSVIIAVDKEPTGSKPVVLINPKLTPLTTETQWNIEGCLSIPGACGLVKRITKVRVEYNDLESNLKTLEADGMFARVLQHEIDHLNGVLYTDKTLLKQITSAALKPKALADYAKPLQLLSERINSAAVEARDPYSLSYDVRQRSGSLEAFKAEIETLLKSVLSPQTPAERAEKLNQWVRSEAHALLLYDLMNGSGLNHFKEELSYLRKNNLYFIESRVSGGGLITYAFEKEGSSADISLLYRPPNIPEDQWLSLPEADRIEQLKSVKIPLKTFTKSELIMPTELKPESVGGYSVELSDSVRKGYGWEISHKKYEIDRQRLMRQVWDLSKMFKQTHSFQVHIVFEFPKKYSKYKDFIYWYKQVNDYLYLKGLEEGLHGNYLTGVANVYHDLSFGERINSWVRGLWTTDNTIPERQKKLKWTNSKFFSAGLRAGNYGAASSPDSMKLGIELRDVTRDIKLLDQYTEQLSKSIEAKTWEKSNLENIQQESLRLTSSVARAQQEMLKIVGPKYAKIFATLEPTAYFGLIRFEDANYFDYRTGKWNQATPAMKERFQQARAAYEVELRNLETELATLEKSNDKADQELIKMALRVGLATWAKKAKVSELFGGI